ncbi:hypothetical protein RH858_16265 [Halalkaliarchaeum sp. AArc-GB]|uniref:hypothetical protein n=1 Tax=Halalkaliarchaeum sp. AArc-GB TaxID=3074078 RepID=UPI00285AED59|nr:hypothetical protein [Halalkaliarchaeum sp. AArc-GB]MDR5674679.1 hypothetical protein [Halalkaliarchaeum sp. AArc-GB]
MPGFHKHKGADSYYFVPKRHGDFHTYQLEPEARDMVLATGNEDGDIVSWDIFYTLNDLGLLYFKNSDADPRDTAPDPSAVDFDIVSELSVEKRCAFVERVLTHYELHEVDSNAFHRVVVSLSEASSNQLDSVLDKILDHTPASAECITPLMFFVEEDLPDEFDSVALAVVLHYAYVVVRQDDNASTIVDLYDGESFCETEDYIYYLVSADLWDTEDDVHRLDITLPETYQEGFKIGEVDEDAFLSLCESVLSASLRVVLGEKESRIGRTVIEGLSEVDDTSLFVAPKESVSGTDEDTLSEIVASFDESM